jgi:hypothetical protein
LIPHAEITAVAPIARVTVNINRRNNYLRRKASKMSIEIDTRWTASNKQLGWMYSTRKEAEAKYKELKAEGYASLFKTVKITCVDVEELK